MKPVDKFSFINFDKTIEEIHYNLEKKKTSSAIQKENTKKYLDVEKTFLKDDDAIVTSNMLGEEGGDDPVNITQAVGENGEDTTVTSDMLGEEGGDDPVNITQAVGENGEDTTVTSDMLGEEGGDDPVNITQAIGEDGSPISLDPREMDGTFDGPTSPKYFQKILGLDYDIIPASYDKQGNITSFIPGINMLNAPSFKISYGLDGEIKITIRQFNEKNGELSEKICKFDKTGKLIEEYTN